MLRSERVRGRVAARRLLVIAGLAAAALLAFALLAASLRRRDVGLELARLRGGGRASRQLLAFVGMEAAVLAGTGVVAGAGLAVAGTALAGEAVAGDAGVLLEDAGLTVLVGPSGSGKTTLLHLIAGLELPTAGEVEVGGRALATLGRAERAAFRREALAFVPQAAALAGHLSARENVARALVARPAILLVDEPTANLDQRNAIAVARLLAGAARRDHMLVLCATHDPSVIAEADRVVELGG